MEPSKPRGRGYAARVSSVSPGPVVLAGRLLHCGGSWITESPRSGCGRGPAEVRIIPPHAVKDDGEFAGNRNYRFLYSAPASHRDAPRLERVPAAWPG